MCRQRSTRSECREPRQDGGVHRARPGRSTSCPSDASISDPVFERSVCHMHHHVRNYASYEILDEHGVVFTARKQAFCSRTLRPCSRDPSSSCSCQRQGIPRGWADVYSRYLPCPWIDVTGLASGTYTLRIVVNPAADAARVQLRQQPVHRGRAVLSASRLSRRRRTFGGACLTGTRAWCASVPRSRRSRSARSPASGSAPSRVQCCR